jgi:multiple sugar transport system ATP-binding protein
MALWRPAARAGRGGGPKKVAPLAADIDLFEALGSKLFVHFTIDAKRVLADGAQSGDAEAATISGDGVARFGPKTPVKAGDRITFSIDTDGLQLFDPDSGAAISS